MSDEVKQVAMLSGSTGLGTAIASAFNWIGANATTIGALCSIITLVAYLYFQNRADKKLDISEQKTKIIQDQDVLIKELQANARNRIENEKIHPDR
jgi:hypothetical protein